MLRDAEFFKARISKLDGAGDLGDFLISIVNRKAVAEKTKVPEAPATSSEKPSEPQLAGEKT